MNEQPKIGHIGYAPNYGIGIGADLAVLTTIGATMTKDELSQALKSTPGIGQKPKKGSVEAVMARKREKLKAKNALLTAQLEANGKEIGRIDAFLEG